MRNATTMFLALATAGVIGAGAAIAVQQSQAFASPFIEFSIDRMLARRAGVFGALRTSSIDMGTPSENEWMADAWRMATGVAVSASIASGRDRNGHGHPRGGSLPAYSIGEV